MKNKKKTNRPFQILIQIEYSFKQKMIVVTLKGLIFNMKTKTIKIESFKDMIRANLLLRKKIK